MLIIKCLNIIPTERLNEIKHRIEEQAKEGIIVLPHYLDAIQVPNDVKIVFEDKARGDNKGLAAQPEIIRCYQCKYAEVADSEDSQDGYTCQFHRGSIWFSGSYCSWAERREDG